MALPITIAKYYSHSLGSARGNILRTGDQAILRTDTGDLVQYYQELYALPQLELANPEPQVIPMKPSRTSNATNSVPTIIRYDIERTNKTEEALRLRSRSPEENTFTVDSEGFFVVYDLSPDIARAQLTEHTKKVLKLLSIRNNEIQKGNENLKASVTAMIHERKSRVKAQDHALTLLSKVIPLTINRKPSAPVVPLVKKTEIRINPPQPKKLVQPTINPKILESILDILDRGGKTFERAPDTFNKLDEPDLRNILISFLNGNFEAKAVGEAFNKLGKTDISLPYSGDNLFVAECKFWHGSNAYAKAIEQLFRYLTWRENLGVILSFVKERDFTSIIEKTRQATTLHRTYIPGSLKKKFDSYFHTQHIFPEDKEKRVNIHHLLFSLYQD